MTLENKKRVDVLIVSTVEPFKNLDRGTLPWRSGRIFELLIDNHVSTKIVTSTFNHYTKSFRPKRVNGDFVLMKSISYRNNISIWRFLNYCIHVPQLIRIILKYRPKLVVITLPPVVHLLAMFVVKIIDPKIKFWIDVRDLWPEIFIETFSKYFTKTGASTMFGMSLRLRKAALNVADYVTTISPLFADLLRRGEPGLISKIKWFPHPKSIVPVTGFLNQTSEKIKFVYVGSLSARTDLLNFIRDLSTFVGKSNCEFIIGGRGALEGSLNALKKEGIYLTYLGWVPGDQVNEILVGADFGLIPYPATIDFDSSFPNKYLEYCALGMRTVSRPLSIYCHDYVPLEIRPYFLDNKFKDILKTKFTGSERQTRQRVFEESLSDVKMREYVTNIMLDLAQYSKG